MLEDLSLIPPKDNAKQKISVQLETFLNTKNSHENFERKVKVSSKLYNVMNFLRGSFFIKKIN